MKTKLVICFFAVLSLAANCKKEDCHKTISFVNNSHRAIYFYPGTEYPDTTSFFHYAGLSSSSQYYKIQPGETNTQAFQNRSCLEASIESYPEKTLMVFVFDADTVETVPWSDICQRYLVLKRYNFTVNDLNNLDWTINYQ